MNLKSLLSRRLPAALTLSSLCLSLAVAPNLCAKEPREYLSADRLNPAILAPPPLPKSEEQAADMAQVVAVFHACSSNQTELAFSEKKFSVFTFTPAIGAYFISNNLPKTAAFFERVQTQAETVTDQAKEFWKRPRPYTIDPSLAAGKLEKTFSYPSGHSTEGTVLALVLAEACPEQRLAILDIGRNLGWHRVWIARHYPTDIYAGRVYAQAIVREMKTSAAFQQDLAEVKSEIESVRAAGRKAARTSTPPVAATAN